MENKIRHSFDSEEIENYLQHFIYTVPKKNHDALTKNLRQFIPWFRKHGARVEYYQLGRDETQSTIDSAKQSGMDIMDNIDKTLFASAENNEEIWIEQQYFKDYKHCQDVYAEMMQDKSLEPLGKEFFDLITHGRKLITGGFNRLEE
ncbi:MAG: DUF1428 family protein [Nitrososphaera sp.]